MVAALLSCLLALVVTASALAKLSHRPGVVAMYATAGVPERWLSRLAGVLLSAAGALVAGLWWPGLGIVAAVGLVAYFAVAVAFHARADDLGHAGMPVLLGAMSLATAVSVAFGW
jgi:hypothetical protein